MRGKERESQTVNSSSTYYPHLRPISFKNPNSKSTPQLIPPIQNPNHDANLQRLPDFTHRRHWYILTTTVFSFSSATTCGDSRLYAAVSGDEAQLLHPLTLKPHPYNRPINVDSLNRQSTPLVSFNHTTNFPLDKLVVTLPRATTVDGDAMVVLYGGGKLLGRLPLIKWENSVNWVVLSEDRFDDIVACIGCTYVIDRLGRLYVINNITHPRDLSLGGPVIAWLIEPLSVWVGWRRRIMVYWGGMYLVVRAEEKVFRVYQWVKGMYCWVNVDDFGGGVLFVSKDCCFFMDNFGGKEYEDCIVFSESGFPKYGEDCWEYNDEDKIGVFRITDQCFGWVGESADFPDIDWSLPSWTFAAREPDEDNGVVQSNANVERDTSLQEYVSASLVAYASAVEGVRRTRIHTNGENEVTEKESSRKNTKLSAPGACTSSSTTKGDKSYFATTKFEGFDIRSDLVPTLQKIWRNHGNITENSTIRNSDIIARGLESLAIMVQILENNSVVSLSESQDDYLSTTFCDLKSMGFKVHWWVSFVQKTIKLHRSKALADLNKLSALSTQVKELKAILLDEVAKLNEEENKLKKEMAKVANKF